jgi:hypothetical protein
MKPLTPFRAMAALGMSLLAQNLSAAPPATLSDTEKTALQADATSTAPAAEKAAAAAHASLDQDLADSAAATKDAATFLVQADIPAAPATSPGTIPASDKPLPVTPAVTDTVIQCEGGMYFDPDEGVLVYLKNVTVKDPRFNLSGANELKIFFGKKPAKEAKEGDKPEPKKDKPKNGLGAGFGEVERIVATGAVLIEQKPTAADKEPIKASGAIFSYNLKADQIIIQGGFPWVLQGATFMRAKEANLILRISPKAGNFITEGNWEMGGNLEQKKPNP